MIFTAINTHENSKITLYDQIFQEGRAIPLTESVRDLSALTPTGFEVRSLTVDAGSVWRLYTGVNFTGTCIFQTSPPPGIVGSIMSSSGSQRFSMRGFEVIPRWNDGSSDRHVSLRNEDQRSVQVKSVQRMTAEIILYNNDNFMGSNLPITGSIHNLGNYKDKTSSTIVVSGRWRLYDNHNYGGNSAEFVTGNYPIEHLQMTVGNDAVSSVRLEAYD